MPAWQPTPVDCRSSGIGHPRVNNAGLRDFVSLAGSRNHQTAYSRNLKMQIG